MNFSYKLRSALAFAAFSFGIAACGGHGGGSLLPHDTTSFGAMNKPGTALAAGGSLDNDILTLNPVAFYKLDETSGAVVHDSSRHGYDLTNQTPTSITLGVPGIANDGGTAYTLTSPSSTIYGNPANLWGAGWYTIVVFANGNFSAPGWHTLACFPYFDCIAVNGGHLGYLNEAFPEGKVDTSTTLKDNTTYMLALRWKGDGTGCEVSADGAPWTYVGGSCVLGRSTPYAQIGASTLGIYHFPSFVGTIDDVAYFSGRPKGALTQPEICQLAVDASVAVPTCPHTTPWPAPTPTPTPPSGTGRFISDALADGPLALYPLNDTSGTVAKDLGPNAYNGTYVGNPMLAQPGLILGDPTASVALNGSSQRVTLPTLPLTTYLGGYIYEPITVFAVIDPATTSGVVASYHGFGLSVKDGYVGFWSWFEDGGQWNPVAPVTPGKPHFVAATCSCMGSPAYGYTVSVYVDGHPAADGNTKAFGQQLSEASSNIGWETYVNAYGTFNNYFAGRLQDVGIYQKILTAAQICQLANDAAFPGVCAGPTPTPVPTPTTPPPTPASYVFTTYGARSCGSGCVTWDSNEFDIWNANANGTTNPLYSVLGAHNPASIMSGPGGELILVNASVNSIANIMVLPPVGSAYASGMPTPTSEITGAATLLNWPGTAVTDGAGNISVLNITEASPVYGQTGVGILKFASGATGNVAPIAKIPAENDAVNTTLSYPADIAEQSDGTLYVANRSTNPASQAPGDIVVFAPGANGDVAPARTIGGSNTQITFPYSVSVDTRGYAYVLTCDNWAAATQSGVNGLPIADLNPRVVVFAPGATGNVPPIAVIQGTATGFNAPIQVRADPSGVIFVADYGAQRVFSSSRR